MLGSDKRYLCTVEVADALAENEQAVVVQARLETLPQNYYSIMTAPTWRHYPPRDVKGNLLDRRGTCQSADEASNGMSWYGG